MSPEGAGRYGGNRLRRSGLDHVHIFSPFRAKRLFWLTQGKPRVNPGPSFLALGAILMRSDALEALDVPTHVLGEGSRRYQFRL
jgi:hypothetical protein